eukprot:1784630-Rhodomonas_salina.1
MAQLCVGQQVRIVGLEKAQHYNGTVGIIAREQEGRWIVRLEGDKDILVKADNIYAEVEHKSHEVRGSRSKGFKTFLPHSLFLIARPVGQSGAASREELDASTQNRTRTPKRERARHEHPGGRDLGRDQDREKNRDRERDVGRPQQDTGSSAGDREGIRRDHSSSGRERGTKEPANSSSGRRERTSEREGREARAGKHRDEDREETQEEKEKEKERERLVRAESAGIAPGRRWLERQQEEERRGGGGGSFKSPGPPPIPAFSSLSSSLPFLSSSIARVACEP